MPSPPTVTRSLGATAPSRPNAAAGTISGAAASAPVPSAVLSASRLDRPFPFVAIDALLPVRHHNSSSTVGDAKCPQLADSKQGDTDQRKILVSRIICK